MTSDVVLPIILGVLTVLGGTGFWGYRQSRKEAPVKKRDADIAAADQSVQMALAVATAARDDNAALRADLNTEREARQKLSGRVEGLETHVREQDRTIRGLREVVRVLSDWADDVIANWHTIRLEEMPPKKPGVTIDQP